MMRAAIKHTRFLLFLLGMLVFALTEVNEAQAAPTFQAAGTAGGGAGAVSPAWPAHQVGDVALLFVESSGDQAVTLSVPAGFVAVANSPQFTFPGGPATGTRITVFWARATSTAMSTPTVADPGNHVYAPIITYRGIREIGGGASLRVRM